MLGGKRWKGHTINPSRLVETVAVRARYCLIKWRRVRESDGEGAWAKFYRGGGEHCGGIAVSLPGSVSAWRVHCTHSLQHCLSTSGYQTSYTYKVGSQLSWHIFRLFLLNTYVLLPAISSFFSGSVAKTPAFVSIHQLSHTAGTEDKTETRTLAHCPRLNWDSLVSCRPFTLLGLGWRVERYGYRRLESEGEQVNY